MIYFYFPHSVYIFYNMLLHSEDNSVTKGWSEHSLVTELKNILPFQVGIQNNILKWIRNIHFAVTPCTGNRNRSLFSLICFSHSDTCYIPKRIPEGWYSIRVSGLLRSCCTFAWCCAIMPECLFGEQVYRLFLPWHPVCR